MRRISFCKKWAAALSAQQNLSPETESVVAFAIEVLFINLINLVLTLSIGWILGVFVETAIVLFTVAVFRHTAGGAHSESPWRCAAGTAIVFPLLGVLGNLMTSLPSVLCDMISVLAIGVGFYLIYKYAPVDSPAAPIVSLQRRNSLRNKAFWAMAIFSLVIIGAAMTDYSYSRIVQQGAALGVLWVSLNLSNLGIRLWSVIDHI
jgi:accessory gene regulator B